MLLNDDCTVREHLLVTVTVLFQPAGNRLVVRNAAFAFFFFLSMKGMSK